MQDLSSIAKKASFLVTCMTDYKYTLATFFPLNSSNTGSPFLFAFLTKQNVRSDAMHLGNSSHPHRS